MGLFTTNKPKGFNHKYIYYDERKEKLQQIEKKAQRELGMAPQESYNPERIRGRFVDSTVHLKRKKEKGGARFAISPVLLFALIVLIMLMYYLKTGCLPFQQ